VNYPPLHFFFSFLLFLWFSHIFTIISDNSKQEKEDQTLALVTALREMTTYDHILTEISRETRKNTVGIVNVTPGKSPEPHRRARPSTEGTVAGADDEGELTPELRRAIARLSTQYEQALNQIILSVQQDAQSRKGLADDNSWLGMQTSQLKKQLEDAFTQGKTKSSATSSTSPTSSSSSSSRPNDDGCTIS